MFSVLWCWAWKMFLPYLHTHTVTQCPRNFLVIEQYELKSKHFHGKIMIPNICKSKISYFSTFLTVDTTLFLEATTLTLKDWAELIVVVQQSLMWLQGMITPRLWRWEREKNAIFYSANSPNFSSQKSSQTSKVNKLPPSSLLNSNQEDAYSHSPPL